VLREWGWPGATAGARAAAGKKEDGVPMPKRILIVDDDTSIATLLTEALGMEGYETVTVTQDLRFFDAVKEHQPDLVVLDMMMPYLDGKDELTLLHLDPEIPGIPVIIYTAFPNAQQQQAELRQLGVVEIIDKATGLEKLTAAIKRTIGEPQGVAR
jgi:CheY-like chemotaxis protein